MVLFSKIWIVLQNRLSLRMINSYKRLLPSPSFQERECFFETTDRLKRFFESQISWSWWWPCCGGDPCDAACGWYCCWYYCCRCCCYCCRCCWKTWLRYERLLLLLRKHSLQQQFARHAGKFGQSSSNKKVSFSLQSWGTLSVNCACGHEGSEKPVITCGGLLMRVVSPRHQSSSYYQPR